MGEHETGDDLLQLAAEALFAHEQCDRRQLEDVRGNWDRRLSDDDQIEYPGAAAAVLEAVLPEVRARAAAVWDEAINHVWELSDPVSTIMTRIDRETGGVAIYWFTPGGRPRRLDLTRSEAFKALAQLALGLAETEEGR